MIFDLKSSVKVLTIATILVAACTERIDIKTDDAPSRVVIYGYISTDTVSLRITRSAGYFTAERPEGVSKAVVTITDCDDNEIILTECETEVGLYLAEPFVRGVENRTYTLDVVFNHDDGSVKEHFQADAYLQDIHRIDSIGLRPVNLFGGIVQVLLYADNFGENNNYAFFVAINDSIVNSTINRFMVINDSYFMGETYIDGVECYFLFQNPEIEYRNEVLKTGDKVTLTINAISAEYASFISAAQSEIGGSNPIFGGPPANVPTNIRRISASHGAPAPLGFFAAFPSRHAHTIVKEEFNFNRNR